MPTKTPCFIYLLMSYHRSRGNFPFSQQPMHLLHQSLCSSTNHRIILRRRNQTVSHYASSLLAGARSKSLSSHHNMNMHHRCHSFVHTRYYASTAIYRQKPKLAYEWIVNGMVIPQSQVKDDTIASSVHEDGKEVILFLHGLLGNAKV